MGRKGSSSMSGGGRGGASPSASTSGGGSPLQQNADMLNRSVDAAARIAASSGSVTAVARAARDAVDRMQIGNTVTVKDYRRGTIMQFEKLGNIDSITAFRNVLGNNHMASPSQVKSWVWNSALYADYKPVFG